MDNRTPEQKFEDYLEDEYQDAVKENDEYYEQQLETYTLHGCEVELTKESIKEIKRAENITTIGGLLAFPVSAALGYGFVQLLKLIIPGWGG